MKILNLIEHSQLVNRMLNPMCCVSAAFGIKYAFLVWHFIHFGDRLGFSFNMTITTRFMIEIGKKHLIVRLRPLRE